ncbi:MAG: T9SS type A sorting domain-containing protein [Lentimicrobiaceae bacterium]|nr:T9SS type A sorting domain-containing protein [Lentimicrobiaceae bacterium]
MRYFYFLKFMVIVFLLANNGGLNAQSIIEENSQVMPGSSVKYKHYFNSNDYTKILDENGRKVYTLNHLPGQNNTLVGKESVDDVTLNINLVFDPDQYEAPWVINVFDETGYMNGAFWEGANPVTINVPPGSYDIYANFTSGVTSRTSHIVIKELVDVQEETTIEVDVAEADNHITTAIYNETGEPLEPGIYDPGTGTITGGNAGVMADRSLFFAPINSVPAYFSYYWSGRYSEDEEPVWNFYISDVSNRYSIIQTIFGMGYEGDNYFTKYETLTGISESVNLENNPEDWVFLQEKFQPSPLGEAAGAVYPGFSTLSVWEEGCFLGGWMVSNMGGNGIDPEEGFRVYLNNPFDENPSDWLVFPSMVDYRGIIDPECGEEDFLITSNAIVAGNDNEVIYGSGNLSFGQYFLGDAFYNTETGLKFLPFHPQFSFTSTDNLDIKQGNNTPIAVSAVRGVRIKTQYKGRYGETRESDFFNTHVEIKQNSNVVFSGSYIDFMQFFLPDSGLLEATFTNSNIEVDGLAGKNITQVIFDKEAEDATPPTLQMLQFRNISGKVTDRFTSAAEGTVRLAAGDFEFIPGSSHFAYKEGNTVELSYSLYDQNDWTELELTKYPEYFQMPAFGDYYEASLEGIENAGNDVWYDVRIVCTDAAGNKQEQVVSPAFKINNTVGVKEPVNSSGGFYPNPVTDILTVENPGNEPCSVNILNTLGKVVYSGPVTNESTQSMNMKSLNLPSGIYFIQLVSNHKTIAGKKIIYKK